MKLSVKTKFDAEKVTAGVRKGNIRALRSAGAYTRKIAMNAIKSKKNPNIASAPGTAPYTHGRNKTFRKSILFGVNEKEESVVIGPAALGGDSKLAQLGALHEFGGTKPYRQPSKRIPGNWDTAKSGPVRKKNGVFVFGKLLTNRQRKRAWQLEAAGGRFPDGQDKKELKLGGMMKMRQRRMLAQKMASGHGTKKTSVYPARPFMKPTLNIVKPKLPAFWSGVVK